MADLKFYKLPYESKTDLGISRRSNATKGRKNQKSNQSKHSGTKKKR